MRGGEKAFTLIELLTVIATLGVLVYMGLTAFQLYKSTAAYGVLKQTYSDARNAIIAGIVNFDNPPGAVNAVQNSKGELQNAAAHALMAGFIVPGDVKIEVHYDPDCLVDGCEQAYIELWHCKAKEHLSWTRLGDGYDMLMEHLSGGSC